MIKQAESLGVDINTINFVLSALKGGVEAGDIISQLVELGRKEEEVDVIFSAVKRELARRQEEGEETSVEVPTRAQVHQLQQAQHKGDPSTEPGVSANATSLDAPSSTEASRADESTAMSTVQNELREPEKKPEAEKELVRKQALRILKYRTMGVSDEDIKNNLKEAGLGEEVIHESMKLMNAIDKGRAIRLREKTQEEKRNRSAERREQRALGASLGQVETKNGVTYRLQDEQVPLGRERIPVVPADEGPMVQVETRKPGDEPIAAEIPAKSPAEIITAAAAFGAAPQEGDYEPARLTNASSVNAMKIEEVDSEVAGKATKFLKERGRIVEDIVDVEPKSEPSLKAATPVEEFPDVDTSSVVNPFMLKPDAQADLDALVADVHASVERPVEVPPAQVDGGLEISEQPQAAQLPEKRTGQPEKLTAREIEDLKKSYDPMFRLLKKMSEDPEANFKAEDVHFNYRVFMPSRDEKGEITGRAETPATYHDLLQLRATIPEDLRQESDPLVWTWKLGGTWGKIATFADTERLWNRLDDPNDKLAKYRDEIYALVDQIRNERLPDEYAQAVERGEIQFQEIPERDIWRAYSDIAAMYGDEFMPDAVREKYRGIQKKLTESEYGSDEFRAASKEMLAFVDEQWQATISKRAANPLDFDTWSSRLNTFGDQHGILDLAGLFPEGKIPLPVRDRNDELRHEFIRALNAGDETRMAEVAAEADAFFAAQRLAVSEAKGTPSSEIESKNIQFDEVEAIVREQLRGKAKINNLTVNPTPDGLQLHAELDAGMMGGEIVLDGTIVNDGNTIAIHGLDIGARGFVKSIIQDKLGKFDTAIKTYFEKKFGKPISKMQIGGSGLSIELENQVAPIVSDQEEVTAGDEEDAVPDIDSRAEGVGLLKKTVEAAKGKLYEAKEKVKWWKSSEERLIRRRAELDVQAEKIGGVERWFRKLGERYNKLSFTKKVAIGAGLGVGAVVTAGSLAMAIPLLGIGAQRALGLATMYLKYEKESHDEAWGKNREWGKQKALLKAGVYTVIMGLTMKEAIELVSQTDLAHAAQAKVDGWLSSVFGNQSPTEAPRAAPAAPPAAPASNPAAPAATASSAPAAPQATAPEVAASQPEPVATGAEGAATAPAQAAPAEAAPAENVSGTKPADAPASAAEAGAEPSAPASEVAAAAQSEVSAQSAATAAETASAAEAPQSAGMNLIPDYASEAAAPTQPEIPAQPVLEAPRGPVEGMNFIPEYEPATEAPRPEVPTDTGRVGVQSSLSERESLVPDRAVEGPAGVAGTTANEVTVHPRAEGEDILIRTQEPAPLVDKDFFVNKFDVTVPIAEPHIYAGPPGTTTVFAYGGEKMVRLNAMFDYLKTHPDSTVIAEDDSGKYRAAWTLVKDRLVQGERLPQSGFFGRLSGALLPPPGPDELSKLIK